MLTIASVTAPPAITIDHIDATPLGMIAGGVVTAIVVTIGFLLVGWLLLKYKIVVFGSISCDTKAIGLGTLGKTWIASQIPDECPRHAEEKARSIQNQLDIARLAQEAREDRALFWKELKAIRKGVTVITNGLLAKQIIIPSDLPREEL